MTSGTYYTLSLILNSLTLVLGAIYFFKRLSFEKERDCQERIRKRVDILLSYLTEYDKIICSILVADFESAPKLENMRMSLSRSFETIQAYLEHNEKLLKFSESQMSDLTRLFSFIDKSGLVQIYNHEHVKDSSRQEREYFKRDYSELLQSARLSCLSKLD